MPKGIYQHKKGYKQKEGFGKKMSEVNLRLERRPPSRKGQHHTEETKAKMRGWRGGKNNIEKKLEIAGRPKPKECEICKKTGLICFDHDHKTGKFRGWICMKCNSALGMVEDNPEILIEMIKYLDNNSQ